MTVKAKAGDNARHPTAAGTKASGSKKPGPKTNAKTKAQAALSGLDTGVPLDV